MVLSKGRANLAKPLTLQLCLCATGCLLFSLLSECALRVATVFCNHFTIHLQRLSLYTFILRCNEIKLHI